MKGFILGCVVVVFVAWAFVPGRTKRERVCVASYGTLMCDNDAK